MIIVVLSGLLQCLWQLSQRNRFISRHSVKTNSVIQLESVSVKSQICVHPHEKSGFVLFVQNFYFDEYSVEMCFCLRRLFSKTWPFSGLPWQILPAVIWLLRELYLSKAWDQVESNHLKFYCIMSNVIINVLELILDMRDHFYLGQNIYNNNDLVDNVIFITPVE